MTDNLATQVEFVRAVQAFDPGAGWATINANHLPPSGSSILHPHLQGSGDPAPSTLQAMLAEVGAERFEDYVATERRLGERFIADTGRVRWLASFAPIGFNEVRGVVAGLVSPAQLDEATIAELGAGIARILNLYAELGHQTFNIALLGAPQDGPDTLLNIRLVCRSNPDVHYRSDAMYSERLPLRQAMVDPIRRSSPSWPVHTSPDDLEVPMSIAYEDIPRAADESAPPCSPSWNGSGRRWPESARD